MTLDRKKRIRDSLSRGKNPPPPPKRGGRPPRNSWDDNPNIRPDIRDILNHPESYIRGAREDILVHDAHFVRQGSKDHPVPLIHLTWHMQGWHFHLNEDEREELGRQRGRNQGRDKGHYIRRKQGQYQLFYRESKPRHLWLGFDKQEGEWIWGYVQSKNLRPVWQRAERGRKAWVEIGRLIESAVPNKNVSKQPSKAIRWMVEMSLGIAVTRLEERGLVPEDILNDSRPEGEFRTKEDEEEAKLRIPQALLKGYRYRLCVQLLCSEVVRKLQKNKRDLTKLVNEYISKTVGVGGLDESMVEMLTEENEEASARHPENVDRIDEEDLDKLVNGLGIKA